MRLSVRLLWVGLLGLVTLGAAWLRMAAPIAEAPLEAGGCLAEAIACGQRVRGSTVGAPRSGFDGEAYEDWFCWPRVRTWAAGERWYSKIPRALARDGPHTIAAHIRPDARQEAAGRARVIRRALVRPLSILAEELDALDADWAIAGATAMGVHGYERATNDVDVA